MIILQFLFVSDYSVFLIIDIYEDSKQQFLIVLHISLQNHKFLKLKHKKINFNEQRT
jgi:hypothetical protein